MAPLVPGPIFCLIFGTPHFTVISSSLLFLYIHYPFASQVALVVKKPPASAGDIRDMGSILGSGRSPGEGHGSSTHSSLLAWRIPWTEAPGGLQSIGSHRVRHNWSDLTCTSLLKKKMTSSHSPGKYVQFTFISPRNSLWGFRPSVGGNFRLLQIIFSYLSQITYHTVL